MAIGRFAIWSDDVGVDVRAYPSPASHPLAQSRELAVHDYALPAAQLSRSPVPPPRAI